jgi:hypothetical protein
MSDWSIADLMELARALREARDSFTKRRVIQRLDDGSLSVQEATAILRIRDSVRSPWEETYRLHGS